jgi:hypothetical protein
VASQRLVRDVRREVLLVLVVLLLLVLEGVGVSGDDSRPVGKKGLDCFVSHFETPGQPFFLSCPVRRATSQRFTFGGRLDGSICVYVWKYTGSTAELVPPCCSHPSLTFPPQREGLVSPSRPLTLALHNTAVTFTALGQKV